MAKIRNVSPKDATQICAIYNDYIVNSVVTFEEETIEPSEMLSRIKLVEDDGLPWLVAEGDNGDIIGYAYAGKWHKRYSYRFSVEVTVYLSSSQISKGVGTMLYKALFELLSAKGIHCIIGCITLPNVASIALHEKFSMKKVAHFNEVGLKFGRWLDVGYWQVLLNQ